MRPAAGGSSDGFRFERIEQGAPEGVDSERVESFFPEASGVEQGRRASTREHLLDRRPQSPVLLRVYEQPQPTIEQRVARAFQAAGDHRRATRERFDEDDAEAFLA